MHFLFSSLTLGPAMTQTETSVTWGPGALGALQLQNSASENDNGGARPVEISPSQRFLRYNTMLGHGACKRVFKAFDVVEGIEVAWNQVELQGLEMESQVKERLFSEIHVLQSLHHKNIMSFSTWWYNQEAQTINFITEVFSSGTLRQYRKRMRTHIGENVIRRWAWQILQGLLYLHGHEPPIVHRDLKCDNIFINGTTGQVKIGDLGLATAQKGLSMVGTPEFMAPEIYEEDYDEKVDIYSFGMCLLELATLEYPYSECHGVAQIFAKVIKGVKPKALERVTSDPLRALIEQCIAHDAADRPDARHLLKHPWFDSVRNDLHMASQGSHHSLHGSHHHFPAGTLHTTASTGSTASTLHTLPQHAQSSMHFSLSQWPSAAHSVTTPMHPSALSQVSYSSDHTTTTSYPAASHTQPHSTDDHPMDSQEATSGVTRAGAQVLGSNTDMRMHSTLRSAPMSVVLEESLQGSGSNTPDHSASPAVHSATMQGSSVATSSPLAHGALSPHVHVSRSPSPAAAAGNAVNSAVLHPVESHPVSMGYEESPRVPPAVLHMAGLNVRTTPRKTAPSPAAGEANEPGSSTGSSSQQSPFAAMGASTAVLGSAGAPQRAGLSRAQSARSPVARSATTPGCEATPPQQSPHANNGPAAFQATQSPSPPPLAAAQATPAPVPPSPDTPTDPLGQVKALAKQIQHYRSTATPDGVQYVPSTISMGILARTPLAAFEHPHADLSNAGSMEAAAAQNLLQTSASTQGLEDCPHDREPGATAGPFELGCSSLGHPLLDLKDDEIFSECALQEGEGQGLDSETSSIEVIIPLDALQEAAALAQHHEADEEEQADSEDEYAYPGLSNGSHQQPHVHVHQEGEQDEAACAAGMRASYADWVVHEAGTEEEGTAPPCSGGAGSPRHPQQQPCTTATTASTTTGQTEGDVQVRIPSVSLGGHKVPPGLRIVTDSLHSPVFSPQPQQQQQVDLGALSAKSTSANARAGGGSSLHHPRPKSYLHPGSAKNSPALSSAASCLPPLPRGRPDILILPSPPSYQPTPGNTPCNTPSITTATTATANPTRPGPHSGPLLTLPAQHLPSPSATSLQPQPSSTTSNNSQHMYQHFPMSGLSTTSSSTTGPPSHTALKSARSAATSTSAGFLGPRLHSELVSSGASIRLGHNGVPIPLLPLQSFHSQRTLSRNTSRYSLETSIGGGGAQGGALSSSPGPSAASHVSFADGMELPAMPDQCSVGTLSEPPTPAYFAIAGGVGNASQPMTPSSARAQGSRRVGSARSDGDAATGAGGGGGEWPLLKKFSGLSVRERSTTTQSKPVAGVIVRVKRPRESASQSLQRAPSGSQHQHNMSLPPPSPAVLSRLESELLVERGQSM